MSVVSGAMPFSFPCDSRAGRESNPRPSGSPHVEYTTLHEALK